MKAKPKLSAKLTGLDDLVYARLRSSMVRLQFPKTILGYMCQSPDSPTGTKLDTYSLFTVVYGEPVLDGQVSTPYILLKSDCVRHMHPKP